MFVALDEEIEAMNNVIIIDQFLDFTIMHVSYHREVSNILKFVTCL
jgi:hypothetical protein